MEFTQLAHIATILTAIVAIILGAASFYKKRPRIIMRWHLSYTDVSVELTNMGERPAKCSVSFDGLDAIRESGKNYRILLKKDKLVRVLLPHEKTQVLITSPFLVKWFDDPAIPPLTVKVESSFRAFAKGKRTTTSTLRWQHLIYEPPTQETAEMRISKDLKQLVEQVTAGNCQDMDLQWSVCNHAFDFGEVTDEERPCDYCRRYFPEDGVVVRGWKAERVRLGMKDILDDGIVGG